MTVTGKPRTIFHPARFDRVVAILPGVFVVLALLGGTVYAILIPPLQAPDEAGHLLRAYSVSHLQFVPKPSARVSNSVRVLDHWFKPRPWLDPDNLQQLRPESIVPILKIPYSEADSGQETNVNQNVMSPMPYAGTALALSAGRFIGISALGMMYLARFCNLLAFVAVVYLALRLVGPCRPMLLALSLMPMTLSLAASLSADALTIGLAFLLFAYVMKLSTDDTLTEVAPRQLALLALLIVLNALCKSDAILALLVLAIPPSKLGRTRTRRLGAAAGLVVLAFVTVAAWQYLNRENNAAYAAARLPGINIQANTRFIYEHPVQWAWAWMRTVWSQWEFYLRLFVGTLGYYAVWLPRPLVAGYPLMLAAIAVCQGFADRLRRAQRAVMLLTALASAGAVFVLLWDHETTTAVLQAVAESHGTFPSLAGRYFIPFAPLFLVILANRKMGRFAGAAALAAVVLVVTANVAGAVATWKTYYATPPSHTAELPAPLPRTQFGTFRAGIWHLDSDGSRTVDYFGTDAIYAFGGQPEDRPVVGDWSGDGISKIGIYRNGVWLLDLDGNGRFEGSERDRECRLGGRDGDIPVAGDWTGTGKDSIGIFRHGTWLLDAAGTCNTRSGEAGAVATRSFGAAEGDIPAVGHWDGGRRSEIGVLRQGSLWILDSDGNGVLDASDRVSPADGYASDIPVPGDWNGDGRTDTGVYRGGLWVLSSAGCGPDRNAACTLAYGGLPGEFPIAGKWRFRTGRFEHKLVRRPGVTADDQKVYFVEGGQRHYVQDQRWVTSHGYRWPDDVLIIEGRDLESLPVGEPAQ